ncbi:hypothetical protein D8S78_16050 [Natrialba swarupiae]|nr:hypothetical protein [Natrialba swarupiae]
MSNDGDVYAVDAATGEHQWTFTNPADSPVWSSPTVYDGTLYVGISPGIVRD